MSQLSGAGYLELGLWARTIKLLCKKEGVFHEANWGEFHR